MLKVKCRDVNSYMHKLVFTMSPLQIASKVKMQVHDRLCTGVKIFVFECVLVCCGMLPVWKDLCFVL